MTELLIKQTNANPEMTKYYHMLVGRDRSGSVGIGRDRSGSVGIGRDRSGSVGIGRDRSGSVVIE